MLLIRPAFWSALLPRFPRCLGASVPKLFPSLETRKTRNSVGTRTAHDQIAVGIAGLHRAFADSSSSC